MGFAEAKDLVLMACLTGIVGYLAMQVRILVESINELNIKMATIVSHLENHKETLVRHSDQILRIEERLMEMPVDG